MGQGRERLGASLPGTGLRSVVGWLRARPRFRRAAGRRRCAGAAARALLQRPRPGGPETLHRSTVRCHSGATPQTDVGCASAHRTRPTRPLRRRGPRHTEHPQDRPPPNTSCSGAIPGNLARCAKAHPTRPQVTPLPAWVRRAGRGRPLPPVREEGDRGVWREIWSSSLPPVREEGDRGVWREIWSSSLPPVREEGDRGVWREIRPAPRRCSPCTADGAPPRP